MGSTLPPIHHLPFTIYRSSVAAEALAEEVGHLDEEGAAVAAEAGFERAVEGVEAVAVEVVVVAGVEGRPRIRRPAEEELAAHVRGERVVVYAGAGEKEARELVGRAQGED